MYNMRRRELTYVASLIMVCLAFALVPNSLSAQKKDVYVDKKGVMRWGHNKEEVKGFGVNYSAPFAHAYRSAKRLGVDVKQAIDNDIYHFTRLGFDLYRIHVWDTEISDTLGNLLTNEHLDAFDYLLSKLNEHNINYVITPIAYWGNGWPEPDTETPGFSHKYGKGNSLSEPGAEAAGQNYLKQFLNHVNPYTGVAYKNEPNLIAFEVSNEPHHRGEGSEVTRFVKGMVDAMKSTGTKKPIFYNISHGVHFVNDYFEAGINGGTFQWYPTGLTYQKEIPGNLLPNVNDYDIPFDKDILANKGAKLVYEFDAADVGRSYIYPAMARSFRAAGIQIGTQFAYDPTFIAPYNTEYNTHFMNLNYTPQKAISLMITGEVFHQIPRYSSFDAYPANTSFGDFKVDYKEDLAIYNANDKFFYTNNTQTAPKNEAALTKVAGYGNSPIVTYDGQGAYFLDKIANGLWRLEVMPDAIWVDNPFGRNSPKKTVAVINWATHNMQIGLNELGSDFSIEAINDGNTYTAKANGTSFDIRPGTYMLSAEGNTAQWNRGDAFGTNRLSDFYAPATTVEKAWFKHEPQKQIGSNEDLTISVQFVGPKTPEAVQLITSGWRGETIDMEKDGYTYSTTVPADKINGDSFNYFISIKYADNKHVTYPAGNEGLPSEWDFYNNEPYSVAIKSPSQPIYLFEAVEDVADMVTSKWARGFKMVPAGNRASEYQMNLEKLFTPDNENLNAAPVYDFSFKTYILDDIAGRTSDLKQMKKLVFEGRSLNNKNDKLQVAFVLDDGAAYGVTINLTPELKAYELSLADLKPVKTVTMPRPYPSFLPYFLEHNIAAPFDIERIESVQFSIGPGLETNELEQAHGVGIIRLSLQQ